ncbi:uncharacterized protein LOC124276014 isoform X2 [Haliotis rubra]|uniref:uncharacterized protein LOC124276014 isoform X2 n=1 Tax=Haliotis rubra TaxID=36100 RepID=UPI001EE4FC5A|nr:uncharacterized protein LOC124276014 isoform X2 [Haliotis rubra]
MTPWTLVSLLLLLVSVVWERGVATERLLPSEEACKRLCWYQKLCKSLRWNSWTGGCEVSTTEVLSSNRSGVVTFTVEDLEKHWEFPRSGHPCAARPCHPRYLCVPVEAALGQVCLPTGPATGAETDDHVTTPTTSETPTTSTTSNTTECIEVTCLVCFLCGKSAGYTHIGLICSCYFRPLEHHTRPHKCKMQCDM